MESVNEIRSRFPQLSEKVYGKPLVYLDNAATALRPLSVVKKWEEMSLVHNANVFRAVYRTSVEATEAFEAAREAVARHINAADSAEIVFTSGDTAAINLVAGSFGEEFIKEGDEIIVSEAEHHSNLVPWQILCRRKGAKLVKLPVADDGTLRTDLLPGLLTPAAKLLCVADISNVLGIINPVKEIVRICHAADCAVLVDGAQGIVHSRPDVQELDCDFYTFSGHKVYAATGTGVLYAKRKWLDAMPPYMAGGEMIDTVSWESSTYAKAPHKFEAGTPNVAAVPTLVPALEIAEEMSAPEFSANSLAIKEYILESLSSVEGLQLFGNPADAGDKINLFSFVVRGAHHEDLALLMDKMGVALRSGQMCAEPLMGRFGVTGMLRASFAPYNTMQEAEYFIESLQRALRMLR
ncbi:MAG: SufS family cysteine desulfurase [Bacteroidales bacterium]|nr:SufS family cysteine desulfurase [Bacteroidales bacterium]